MPCTIRNLTIFGYGNGCTQWHYKSGEAALGDHFAAEYWQNVDGMLAEGDFLLISCGKSGGIFYITKDGEAIVLKPLVTAT